MKQSKLVLSWFCVSLALPAGAQPPEPSSGAESVDVPQIVFHVMGREQWRLRVEPDRIVGDQSVLQYEDDVVYGFIGHRRVRYKLTKKKKFTRMVGGMDVLAYAKTKDGAIIVGPVGSDKIDVRWEKDHLRLADRTIAVQFEVKERVLDGFLMAVPDNRMQLKFLHGKPRSPDTSIHELRVSLQGRPELLVLLARMVLMDATHFKLSSPAGR